MPVGEAEVAERRVDEIKTGGVELIQGEEVFSKLRA